MAAPNVQYRPQAACDQTIVPRTRAGQNVSARAWIRRVEDLRHIPAETQAPLCASASPRRKKATPVPRPALIGTHVRTEISDETRFPPSSI